MATRQKRMGFDELVLARRRRRVLPDRVRRKPLQFYQTAFHFDVSHRPDFPDFTLVYLRNDDAGAEIELTLE
jgi:hypothetical protein